MKGLKINKTSKLVKIKVKHILIVLATIFVIIPNLIIGISYTIFDMSWYVTDRRIPASYFTQGLLNIYVKLPKISPFEDVAYYIMGKNYYDANESNFIISDGFFKNVENQYSSYNGLENAIVCHKNAIKGKNSGKYYNKNAQSLIGLYYIEGNIDGAKEIVKQMKGSKNNYTKNLGYLNESVLFVKLQDYDKALIALRSIEEKYKNKIEFDFNRYLGQIYMLKGEEKLAKEAFYNSYGLIYKLGGAKSDWRELNYEKVAFGDFYYSEYCIRDEENKKILDERKDIFLSNVVSDENRGDVKGHFIIDGVPMDGTLIELIPQGENSYGNENLRKYPYEITSFSYVNKNGEFYFNNIPEGIYKVNISLPYYKALNSGLDLIESKNQKKYIVMSNALEVVSRRNLKDGKKYNEKYIVASESKQYLGFSDNKNDKSIFKDYEIDLVERIQLKEEENSITLTNKNGYVYPNDILGVDTNEYFGKGESIKISKNFLWQEYNVDTFIKSRFAEFINNSDIYSLRYFNNGDIDGATEEMIEHTDGIEEGARESYFKVSYNEKEKQYINNEDFKGLLKYYEDLYKEGSKDQNIIERLIKLYVIGVDGVGSGKNVNKAIELNEELRGITNNETIYMQIKRYITMFNQSELFLKEDYDY